MAKAKENYCLYLVKDDYEMFDELVKANLSSVSREVNLYMREYNRKHIKQRGIKDDSIRTK